VILQFSLAYKVIQKATEQQFVFQFCTAALLSVIFSPANCLPWHFFFCHFQSWNLAVTEFCGTKRCKFLYRILSAWVALNYSYRYSLSHSWQCSLMFEAYWKEGFVACSVWDNCDNNRRARQ